MKVACTVTCYIDDRYMEAGEAYELPDDFPIVDGYFQRLDVPKVKAEEAEAEKPMTAKEAVNAFVCPTCQKEFKKKIGLIGHSRTHK